MSFSSCSLALVEYANGSLNEFGRVECEICSSSYAKRLLYDCIVLPSISEIGSDFFFVLISIDLNERDIRTVEEISCGKLINTPTMCLSKLIPT